MNEKPMEKKSVESDPTEKEPVENDIAENDSTEQKTAKKKPMNKRKKRALAFAVSAVALAIVSGVSLKIINYYENKPEEKGPTNMYSNELHSYIFYPADYSLDVTTDAAYMALDRYLYFKNGAVEIGIDGDAVSYGEDVRFFQKYFEIAIAGKWEEYNELFTENYYKTNKPMDRFAPQMIYDIHIEKLGEVATDEGKLAYNVSYRIYKNNGTFRNDIDSDASKVLYFELARVDGEYKIDRITYYI